MKVEAGIILQTYVLGVSGNTNVRFNDKETFLAPYGTSSESAYKP